MAELGAPARGRDAGEIGQPFAGFLQCRLGSAGGSDQLTTEPAPAVFAAVFENVTLKSYLERAVEGEDVAETLGGQLTLEQVKALQARDQAIYRHDGDVKSRLPRMREDMERERYLRLMPGYIQGLVERAAPLLGLKVIRDDPGGMFHFAAATRGALDRLGPAMETYPEAVPLASFFTLSKKEGTPRIFHAQDRAIDDFTLRGKPRNGSIDKFWFI
jgi:hypothetical protein